MKSQQRSLMIILILLFLLIAFGSHSQPYTPLSHQQIVARWDSEMNTPNPNMDIRQRINKASWHIQRGQFAGQANKHYGRARALLVPLFTTPVNIQLKAQNAATQSQLLYLWARVLQHQHQFKQAKQVLDQAIIQNPANTSAVLLKANVLLAMGEFNQSKQVCTQLLGIGDLVVTSACVLEASANLGQLANSYQQLSTLLKPRISSNQYQDWLVQLAADMALKLNDKRAAEGWLNLGLTPQSPLASKPLSFIVLWSDVQLALQHNNQVLTQLSKIVELAGFKDDALLTRLSLAEKSSKHDYWQGLLSKRIQLRVARQDTYHSADIVRYFLDIKPDAQLALHWAQINWQQTKLHDDKILLDKALMMQNNSFTFTDS